MMISSIMVYSGADLELGSMLSRILKKIYKYSSFGLYAIFMGFFCGFPMGAKVVSELYGNDKISKSEANTLLAFAIISVRHILWESSFRYCTNAAARIRCPSCLACTAFRLSTAL